MTKSMRELVMKTLAEQIREDYRRLEILDRSDSTVALGTAIGISSMIVSRAHLLSEFVLEESV